MTTPQKEYDKQADRAYQSSSQAKTWNYLNYIDKETYEDVMGDVDDVVRAKTIEIDHAENLQDIEQKFKILENMTMHLKKSMNLSTDSTRHTTQIARMKTVLSKLVAVPEIAAIIEQATGMDTFNKDLCDRIETLSHKLDSISVEIKSLDEKISLQETTSSGPTPVELDPLDKLVALSIQVAPDVRDLAKANTALITRHINDAQYHEALERQGLTKWIELDPMGLLYPRRCETPKPETHYEFLLMATDPSQKKLHYSAISSFVQGLALKSDEYIRQVICTYEVALPQFAKRVREDAAKDTQTVFTCLRLVELLIRLIPTGTSAGKETVFRTAKICTTELALSDGFLCRCIRLYIDNAMLHDGARNRTIADQIYDVALKEHKFAPYSMDDEVLLLADDNQLYLLRKTTKSISVYQEEEITLVMVDSSRIELRIAKIGFCMEILQASETWWEINFPAVCERLFDSVP